ncbi:MAG: hypothetical protein PHU25_10395 [Deltaproteobacteria bacterium]|nr:hypothetical protein [Deltaproteobacteria bacterium]
MVIVVHEGDGPSLVSRIVAELEAMGLGARAVRLDPEDPIALEELARRTGAAAAIRIVPRTGTLHVWIADRVTGKVVSREVVIPNDTPKSEAIVATEAVELLRASLMELRTTREPKGDVAPTPAVKKPVEPQPAPPVATETKATTRLALEVGPAVAGSGFDLPPTVNVFAGAWATIFDPLGIEVLGLTPLVASRTSTNGGEVRLNLGLAGAGLRLGFSPGTGRWLPSLAAGCAAVFFLLDGRAREGHEDHEETIVRAAPFLRAGLAVLLVGRLRLRLDALGGWAFPGTSVRVDGKEIADLGRPLLAAVLALELVVW